MTDLSYGPHERQGIEYFAPVGSASGELPPLIAFVHGGGWSFGDRHRANHAKPGYFTDEGYAYASIGYRVLPDAPVEDQARDVASAIAKLRAEAGRLGFDPDRIVLMGHSAGAHLAALVATDPAYAAADLSAIRAVILLDGAGYDVAANMARRDLAMPDVYQRAFGNDPVRQEALSPITHVGGADAPEWLILHVADRASSTAQSRSLAARLNEAGVNAESVAVQQTDHGRLNRELGIEGDSATAAVNAFLRRLFG